MKKKISVCRMLDVFFLSEIILNKIVKKKKKKFQGAKKSVNSLVIQQRKKDGRFGFLGEKIKK